MAITFYESRHAAEHLVSEGHGYISREAITVAAGADLVPGQVLGQITKGAATSAAKSGGNTGNGTVSAVTLTSEANVGVYSVRFTAATAFTVEDPEGHVIGTGATGAAFSDDIGFTITAGGTPFIAGDGFDITVAVGSKKFVKLAPAATDGSQFAAAILYGSAKAALADVDAVANVRQTEVHAGEITWPAGITTPQKAAAISQLAALGIILR